MSFDGRSDPVTRSATVTKTYKPAQNMRQLLGD